MTASGKIRKCAPSEEELEGSTDKEGVGSASKLKAKSDCWNGLATTSLLSFSMLSFQLSSLTMYMDDVTDIEGSSVWGPAEPQSLERPHSLENDCAVANIEEARAHDSKSKDASEPISHNDKMRALAGISYDEFANLMTERQPAAPAPKFKVVHYWPRSSTLDDELSTISPFGCVGLVQHRFKQRFNSVSEDPCSRFRGRVLTCIDGISREDFFRWPSFLDRTYGAF